MQPKSAKLSLSPKKTCFVSLPVSWTSGFQRDCISVLEIQNDETTVYTSWAGDVHRDDHTHNGSPVIELSGLFAAKHGLLHGQEVALRELNDVPSCSQVFVEPVSVDDWEILEIHASFIESNLLNQLRVVWTGQIIPVWVQKSLCIFIKISSHSPASKCCLLEEQTEVIITPKQRSSRQPRGQTNMGAGDPRRGESQNQSSKRLPVEKKQSDSMKAAQSPSASDMRKKENDHGVKMREETSLTRTRSDMGEGSLVSGMREGEQEVSPGGGAEQPSRDMFQRTFNFLRSLWHGNPHLGHPGSEVQSTSYNIHQELLGCNLDTSLRIQPFLNLEEHLQPCSKGQKKYRPKNVTDIKQVNFVCQPSSVYITESTLRQCLKGVHQHVQTEIPKCFLAIVSKIPSPVERQEALKKKISLTSSESRTKEGDMPNKDKLEDNNPPFPSVILRVVVLDDNYSFRLNNAGNVQIANVQFSVCDGPMEGHIMIPDLLRRQLGLDITGRVSVQSLSDVNITEIKELKLHPLFEIPKGLTEDMLISAFKMWLTDVSCSPCPLVTNQGTLIKFFIKQGFYGEFLITFSGKHQQLPSDNKERVHPHFCMLTREMCEHTNVSVSPQVKAPALPEQVSQLPAWSLEDIDPRAPSVLKMQLEGVSDMTDCAIEHLEVNIGQRLLKHNWFGSSCGLKQGGVLVCGPQGIGKSIVCRAVCRELAKPPNLAYTSIVECTPLRGKRVETVRKQLEQVFREAVWRQPAIILLDDLDQIAPAPTGPEQEMSGEAIYFARMAELLKDFICTEKRSGSRVGLLATCKSRTSLHQTLVNSHGHHFFPLSLEMNPPDKLQRSKLLKSLVLSKPCVALSSVDNLNFAAIGVKTEGCVARDLDSVVDRAIHARLLVNLVKDSKNDTIELEDEDFMSALDGFRPAALRNVSLHQADEVGWQDVGALHQVRHTLVETLQWPSKYAELFGSCPLRLRSGLLLYGAPGTGKTLLAGVVARECGLNFISIKGPELLSKYIGASEQAVRDTFERAQSAKPCILFFDEFDSLAPRRGHDSTGVTDRVVNQLLTQLDGVEGLQGVYVMGATSRPDLIDPALLRPGRLDKALHCPMPDSEERLEILTALTRKMTLESDVDLATLASDAEHFTGADFKALLYNAQLEAIHEHSSACYLGSKNSRSSQNGWHMVRSHERVAVHTSQSENCSQTGKDSKSSVGETGTSSDSSESFQHVPSLESAKVSSSDLFQFTPVDGSAAAFSTSDVDQLCVVKEQSTQRKVTFIPKLEEGPVEVTSQHEQQILDKVKLIRGSKMQISPKMDKNSEVPVVKTIPIQQHHLVKALGSMGPSVSKTEREKYRRIYEHFVGSRGGNFSEATSPGKRATLA